MAKVFVSDLYCLDFKEHLENNLSQLHPNPMVEGEKVQRLCRNVFSLKCSTDHISYIKLDVVNSFS